jgi:hypothetical protein
VNADPRRLGKLEARHDPRTLQLANYLTVPRLPVAPYHQNWAALASTSWGMMVNDSLGDCTCAAAGHAIQTWTANTGTELTIPDEDVVAAYSAITGYTSADPTSDRGAVELDVLNYWRKTGIGGQKIAAFMALEPGNKSHVKSAIDLFGGLYVGARLPVSAQTQRVWSIPPGGPVGPGAPGTWGGHALWVVSYDANGGAFVTWGKLQRFTWGWFATYVDEAYALLSSALWAAPGRLAPSGFAFNDLAADLKLL